MKLNHLSLAVPDVAETAAFMEKFFEFRITGNKGNVIIILEGDGGFILVLTTGKESEAPYPADFHFGFLLNNEAEVLSKYEQLQTAGYAMSKPPSKIRGNLGFYFHSPGGVMMEVSSSLQTENV